MVVYSIKLKYWRGSWSESAWNGKLGADFAKQLTPTRFLARRNLGSGLRRVDRIKVVP